MPPKKKEVEEKRVIKQFKDKSSNWFLDNVHYHLNENGEVVFCAGGIESEEDKEYLRQYIKRNKKSFVAREPSIFERGQVEYTEKFTTGKYVNKTVQEVFDEDVKYLRWMRDSFNFSSAQNKLKEEIINILKK